MVNADGKITDEEFVLGFQKINVVKGNRKGKKFKEQQNFYKEA